MGGFQVEALVKRYGERVLDVPSLSVQEGELLAVVGPSGAGKSTLLRLLHFLEPPTSGIISYSHKGQTLFSTVAEAPLDIRRQIGMVFQRPEMARGSVKENVSLGLHFRGQVDALRVQTVLKELGISHLAQAGVLGLSAGELQRAALAGVLAVEPEVLLLDEPTANLDPANVIAVEAVIKGLKAGGSTVVLVTHNVFQARRLADRVAFLHGGKLIEVGETSEFFTQPADERSRAFVSGEMVY